MGKFLGEAMKDYSLVKAQDIVRLLGEPTDDRRPLTVKLQREAPVRELISALRISDTELSRRILCDILGARRARTAIPALVECLDSPSPSIKDDAAEALGKIGSPRAGPALLSHFVVDPRLWFAVALGAIGYRPAIPYLIEALENPNAMVRGGAAWALEELKVQESVSALEEALVKEDDPFALEHIRKALDYIREEK